MVINRVAEVEAEVEAPGSGTFKISGSRSGSGSGNEKISVSGSGSGSGEKKINGSGSGSRSCKSIVARVVEVKAEAEAPGSGTF